MGRTRRLIGSALAAIGAGLGMAPALADSPPVVASIKPVHSLVAGVMQGAGVPVLLVEGAGSPHTYSLRPSKARALEEAEVVFWVGEGLETFLQKPLRALAADAQVIDLGSVDGIALLPGREGGVWSHHADEHGAGEAAQAHGQHAHEHHGAGPGDADLHLWLDPRNAKAMADAIAAALSRADPEQAATYASNAETLKADLDQLERRLAHRLEPVRSRPFVVFHDAYHYLEHRYGLNAVGSITVSPERRPGARRLQEIRATLDQRGAACVFAEPQFEPALVETVTEGTGARAAVLDPLGAALEPGPGQYFELMNRLADSLIGCLGGSASD